MALNAMNAPLSEARMVRLLAAPRAVTNSGNEEAAERRLLSSRVSPRRVMMLGTAWLNAVVARERSMRVGNLSCNLGGSYVLLCLCVVVVSVCSERVCRWWVKVNADEGG